MDVRIVFRSEIFIQGKNIDEIREKWENMPLYSKEALDHDADEIEVMYAEDCNTNEEYAI